MSNAILGKDFNLVAHGSLYCVCTLLPTFLTCFLLAGSDNILLLKSSIPISFLTHNLYLFCHTKSMLFQHTKLQRKNMCNKSKEERKCCPFEKKTTIIQKNYIMSKFEPILRLSIYLILIFVLVP